MLVDDIIQKTGTPIHLIQDMCGDFLKESEGNPLFKMLPQTYQDIQRVKIRTRKRKDQFSETFNEAFDYTYKLRQRSLFTYTSLIEEDDKEPFFVFPIDGYRYLYNTEITNSEKRSQTSMDVITKDIMVEMLKYTYSDKNLVEGVQSGAEIIFFGIPAFYVARCSIIEYNDIIC